MYISHPAHNPSIYGLTRHQPILKHLSPSLSPPQTSTNNSLSSPNINISLIPKTSASLILKHQHFSSFLPLSSNPNISLISLSSPKHQHLSPSSLSCPNINISHISLILKHQHISSSLSSSNINISHHISLSHPQTSTSLIIISLSSSNINISHHHLSLSSSNINISHHHLSLILKHQYLSSSSLSLILKHHHLPHPPTSPSLIISLSSPKPKHLPSSSLSSPKHHHLSLIPKTSPSLIISLSSPKPKHLPSSLSHPQNITISHHISLIPQTQTSPIISLSSPNINISHLSLRPRAQTPLTISLFSTDEYNHPALLLVDGVSSICAIDFRMDEWGVDVALTGSQKALSLPTGLGIVCASPKALEAAKTAKSLRVFFDWNDYLKFYKLGTYWPYTPSIQLLYGLRAALDLVFEEGLDNVIRRHNRLGTATRLAVEAWGLKNCTQKEEWHSDTVTAVVVPGYIDSTEIVRRAWKRYNLSLGLGLNKVAGKVFRIGHLGNVNELQLLGCLSGVEMVLRDVGYPVKLGSGVAAASAYLLNNTPLIPSRI